MTEAIFFLVMLYMALLSITVVSGAPPPAVVAPLTRRSDCPDMCGDVHIPYPFGIGPNCSLSASFNLSCSNASQLFLFNIRVASITLETAQMVVLTTLTYTCNMSGMNMSQWRSLNLANSAFLVSPEANIFTAIGCNSAASLGGYTGGVPYLTGCTTTCNNLNRAGEDGASCKGKGCCEASLATGLTHIRVQWYKIPMPTNTCQYAFVARKGWYHSSRKDLNGKTFVETWGYGQVVPLVLDWAMKNDSCPSPLDDGNDEKRHIPYGVCISTHSYCINASNGAQGYFCGCNKGYTGNPYKENGCKNINECEPSTWPKSATYESFPCRGGTCQNVEGDYECKCNFGRRGDGKTDKGCERVLPSAAVAVIGTVCAISLTAVLLMFIRMEHEKRRLRDRFKKNGGQLLENMKIEIFRKEELDKITKNYKTIIGKGAFGEVYKGTTSKNVEVAVKRSIAIIKDRQDDFANEIQIQSQMSHKYVVQLLGCCLETEVPMLVYEFVPRGSLYDVLHGKNNNGRREPVPLQVRLDIAICSADAFAYMHSQASQKILHGDVKSGNILLDEEFGPKVSDFGTSRLMSIKKDYTNWVVGDSSYIDPVYMKTGLLTEKSDVYSFGIVLLELITRRKARYDGNNSLPLNYVKASGDGSAVQMYDTEILSSGEDMKCLGEVGLIAIQCLEIDVNDRPTMTEVAEKIKRCKSRWLQSHWHEKTYEIMP